MCQEEVESTDVQSSEFTIVHDNTTGTARHFQNTHPRLEDAEIITFTEGLERWPHLRGRVVV